MAYSSAADVAAVAELAEAERATARRTATPAQAEGVEAAGASRRTEDRVAGWRDRPTPPPPGPRPLDEVLRNDPDAP